VWEASDVVQQEVVGHQDPWWWLDASVHVGDKCGIKVDDGVFQSFGRLVFEKLHPCGDIIKGQ